MSMNRLLGDALRRAASEGQKAAQAPRGSKRRTQAVASTIVAVAVVVVVAIAAGDVSPSFSSSHDQANAPQSQSDGTSAGSGQNEATSNNGNSSPAEQATVERVVDGDTFVATVNGQRERVRMIGIDTPESVAPQEERNTEQGVEASSYTKELLAPGTRVWLVQDVENADKYDRLLRYVWLSDPGANPSADSFRTQCVNALLVDAGMAQAKTYSPNTHWDSTLHRIGAEAAAAGRGVSYMWAHNR